MAKDEELIAVLSEFSDYAEECNRMSNELVDRLYAIAKEVDGLTGDPQRILLQKIKDARAMRSLAEQLSDMTKQAYDTENGLSDLREATEDV